jgi:hypothetical protein
MRRMQENPRVLAMGSGPGIDSCFSRFSVSSTREEIVPRGRIATKVPGLEKPIKVRLGETPSVTLLPTRAVHYLDSLSCGLREIIVRLSWRLDLVQSLP